VTGGTLAGLPPVTPPPDMPTAADLCRVALAQAQGTSQATHDQMVTEKLTAIFAQFKGTGDIAGVAEALYHFNQWHIHLFGESYYAWTVSSNDPQTQEHTFDDATKFMLTQHFACYEFVHFCAYIASDQLSRPTQVQPGVETNDGQVLQPAVYDPNRRWVSWGFLDARIQENTQPDTSDSDVPGGRVVTGRSAWYIGGNNAGGYFHVGIAVGNGQIVDLGHDGLSLRPISSYLYGSAFPSSVYSTILYGPYHWGPLNPAPKNPTTPIGNPLLQGILDALIGGALGASSTCTPPQPPANDNPTPNSSPINFVPPADFLNADGSCSASMIWFVADPTSGCGMSCYVLGPFTIPISLNGDPAGDS